MLKAAVVGLGYWGPNLVRNLAASEAFELVAVCDRMPERLERLGRRFPQTQRFADAAEMLAKCKPDSVPDLVVVCTPVATHHAIAKQALLAGSNVLVTKPMTSTAAQSRDLIETARKVGRRVFVDHTFLYTGAVNELKTQLDTGELGDLYFIDSVRINLGLFQPDVDVIYDLAPHDLSILHYLLGRAPKSVQAMGSCHSPSGFADVAYLHLDYGDALTAHLHVSWLSPAKVRRMILGGTRRSAIFDDLEQSEKVKIYDHGVAFDVNDVEARRQVLVSYRKGEMRAPAIKHDEALALEVQDLARALMTDGSSRIGAEAGLAVVQVLEAASQSLKRDGARVEIAQHESSAS